MNSRTSPVSMGFALVFCATAPAGAGGSFLEDWSTAPGLSNSYLAFEGTRGEATLTAEDEIWIGSIDGLQLATGSSAYNTPLNLPGSDNVLGMGPLFLGTEIVFTFQNLIDAVSFDVFDIETIDAVRLVAFDDAGETVFDSGNTGRALQESFRFEFPTQARQVSFRTVNGDGILLGPITVTPEPLPCNAADLARNYGVLDVSDIGAFVSSFNAQTGPADLNEDSIYDLADVAIFVNTFVAGCP